MSFLEEVAHFEWRLHFVEENPGSQPSDDDFDEDKEQLQPATKKARFQLPFKNSTISIKVSKVHKLKWQNT